MARTHGVILQYTCLPGFPRFADVQKFGVTTEELIASCAQLPEKRPEGFEETRRRAEKSRIQWIKEFERCHGSRIIDFDFNPGAPVIMRNTRIEESPNRKTKPRYIGPVAVVCKTKNMSYLVAELDGTQSSSFEWPVSI